MKSFNEILEEKLQQPRVEKTNFSFFSSVDAYELDLNSISVKFFQGESSASYIRKAGFSSYKVKTKIIKSKPHVLNPKQQIAYDWLISRGASLSDAFSKTELIKSFRQLAFALHPDYSSQTNTQDSYRHLHENKEILLQLFQVRSL